MLMRFTGDNGRSHGANGHAPLSFFLIIPSIFLGLTIVYAGEQGFKWQVAIVLLCLCALLVLTLGSLTRGIIALLILSLSMNVKVNPWFSDSYMEIIPGIPITLSGLCIIALYILWSVDFLSAHPKPVHFFPSVTIPFFLLTLWAGLSVLFSNKPAWTLYELPGVFQAVLIFVYMANYSRSDGDIRFVVRCLAVGVALTGAVCILQHLRGSSFNLQIFGGAPELLQETYAAGTVSRVSGFLSHPNRVAFFLASVLPVILLSSMWTKGIIANISLSLASALGFSALILTYSRGGWASFFFAMLLIAFLFFRRRNRLANLSRLRIRVGVLLVIGCVFVISFAPNILADTRDDYDAANTRVSLTETALRIIKDNPWSGVGYNNYRFVVANYDSHPALNPYGVPEPVHNTYLKTAAELGIPPRLFSALSLGCFSGSA